MWKIGGFHFHIAPPAAGSGGGEHARAVTKRATAAAKYAEEGLTRAKIAAVLGVDERSITNYQAESPPIPEIRDGRAVRFPLGPSVAWYVERERRRARGNTLPSELDMARGRKAIADARRTELDLAQLEARLIPMELHEELYAMVSDRLVAAATGGLAAFVHAVQRADTAAAAQRVLEEIGDQIVVAAASVGEELEREANEPPPDESQAA